MKSRRKSLLNQEQQPSVAQSASKARRATAAFALSLIAGILFIINGILRILQSRALEISGIEDEIRRRILAGIALHLVGAIAVVFGVLVIVGAVLIHKPGKETTGGIIVLVFSILSILTFGVISLVGLILGIIGAALALAKK
jgi:membrane-bound ClpP family serine protease